MIQMQSRLDVADNTGAKVAWTIGVLGRNQRYARVGDIIKVHIKEAAPDGTVKKSEVVNAVVVRSRRAIRRSDGSYLRFDSNAIVIIDKEGRIVKTTHHGGVPSHPPVRLAAPSLCSRSSRRSLRPGIA